MKYSLEAAADRLSAFDSLLGRYGIKYEADSIFCRNAFTIMEMLARHKREFESQSSEDIRPIVRDALGLNDFIAKILNVSDHPNFATLLPHLRMISTGSASQAAPASVTDQDANKLFELYMACLVLPEFKNLVLDDPDHSKGNNPDLLFDAYGKRWAIACKVLHADNTKSIYGNWEKGEEQIRKCKSAHRGIVAISLRNIVAYDSFWPIINPQEVSNGGEPVYRAFPNIDEPSTMLYNYGYEIGSRIASELGNPAITPLISDQKASGGFLTFSQTATGVDISGLPVPTILRLFNVVQFKQVDDEVLGILCRINNQMQSSA